jgi:hypothetical protein
MEITIEIKNHQDLEIINQLAKRLGWVFKSNESTDHLFGNEANKKFLLEQIDYVENGGNLIKVNLQDLKTDLTS